MTAAGGAARSLGALRRGASNPSWWLAIAAIVPRDRRFIEERQQAEGDERGENDRHDEPHLHPCDENRPDIQHAHIPLERLHALR